MYKHDCKNKQIERMMNSIKPYGTQTVNSVNSFTYIQYF